MVYIRGPGKVLLRLMLAVLLSALFLVYGTGIVQANDGNITGVIDTLTFGATQDWKPDLIHVSGNYYAIAQYIDYVKIWDR